MTLPFGGRAVNLPHGSEGDLTRSKEQTRVSGHRLSGQQKRLVVNLLSFLLSGFLTQVREVEKLIRTGGIVLVRERIRNRLNDVLLTCACAYANKRYDFCVESAFAYFNELVFI